MNNPEPPKAANDQTRNATQNEHSPKPLSVILDEIERDFSSVRICKPPCSDCEKVLSGIALVKALRLSIAQLESMKDSSAFDIKGRPIRVGKSSSYGNAFCNHRHPQPKVKQDL